MWTGEVELVDERDLRIGCWQGNCLPPTSLSLKDSASQCHSSVNPCATKGRLAAPPVQEYKRSRMLQLKGWIPETQNAAIEGSSQKAGENGGAGGSQGLESCWDPWKRSDNFCLYRKMTWRQLDKGKAAVQVRLQSPALGAGFYLFSPLGTQHAALLASTVCGANILSTVCMESLLVFLFGLFFLMTLCYEYQSFRIVTSCYSKQSIKSWTLGFTLKGWG